MPISVPRSLIGIFAVSAGIAIWHDWRTARHVPVLTPEPHASDGSTVTVIVPARNEAQRIPALLQGLATQTASDVTVLVLDDSSTDGTSAVVTSYAPRLPGLRVLSGQPLPPHWAGKCWACWQAAQQATTPWLLFLDADAAPAPALIATLLHYAEREHLDFLTILPFLELKSFWERVLMPPWVGLLQAVFPLDKVNDPHSPIALANGQCILIRRAVYMSTGGHAAVHGSVLEDVDLARLVKSRGYRLRIVGAPDLLRVRMYTSLSEIAEGLRKNAWAGYDAGGLRSIWGGIRQILLAVIPSLLLLSGLRRTLTHQQGGTRLLGWALGLTILTSAYWGYIIRRVHRLHPLWAFTYPFGTLGYFMLAARAWLSLRRGRGVTWKGRIYRGAAHGSEQ